MRIMFENNLKLSLAVLLVFIHFSSSAVLNYYRVNTEPGLYSPHDDVHILTIDNFNTSIYGSKKAWMVEFYSNWCGYCQRAAPKYKAFASDIRGWSDLVVPAALDCANEKNGPVCEYFGITRYPTFRFIHEGYVEDQNNTGLPILADSHTNYSEHRKNLVDILRLEQAEGRGKMLPNMQPFNNSDVSKIFDKKQKLGFLIVQEPSDPIGPSIILDFHKVKEAVIRYVYDNDTSISTDTVPALFQVDTSGKLDPLKVNVADRIGIRNVIRDILLAKDIEVPYEVLRNVSVSEIESRPVTLTKEETELREKIKENGDVVYQLDLENALRYSLRREIAGNSEITGEKLDALRKYIDVLYKYFPFGSKGKCLLKQLRHYVNSTDKANGTDIAHKVKETEEQNTDIFLGPPQWLGCRGSTPTKRGYPCGLWKLFHYMTVNAAFDPKTTKDSNPRIILEAMHGYIKHFFGCEDCSMHFQQMAEKRELFKVMSWEESVLWLWRAHNEVNKRLAGDATEDPVYPKVQFPTKERCPQCWKNADNPDEVEILNYLKQMYSKENINYFGANDPQVSNLNMPDIDASSQQKLTSNGLRTIDTSKCIFIMHF